MKSNYASGIASAVGAYGVWGFMPIYWKLVNQVPAQEILAHRFIWSFVFMVFILLAAQRVSPFLQEMRDIKAQPWRLAGVVLAAITITINWLIYIWAVNDNRIIETSLGYYISPLVSILLGIAVLKEKLSFWQNISVLLATLGVLNLTFHFGAIPWVALSLAVSFSLYGLCKKLLNMGAITSITLETLLISPAALLYLYSLQQQGSGAFTLGSPVMDCLLIGTGIATAIPMVLFSNSATLLPLSVLGFIQYLSPTIALFVGIFLYHEPFTYIHLISFTLIWLALATFSFSKTRLFLQMEHFALKKLNYSTEK